jgi:hypothetical protein
MDRAICIAELDAIGVTFRRKASPKRFAIGWDAIWTRAMHIAAEELRKERAARRKARRKAI